MSEPSPAYRDCLLNHHEAEIEAEAAESAAPLRRYLAASPG
jgi:hypothetical protein